MTKNVLVEHLDEIENKLMAEYAVSSNSGHPTNKGTAREIFIKDFLKTHLCQNVSIGSGEIIDSQSKKKESRNQFDIVIYKNNYPKINFGHDIDAFLVESVLATIEVKSTLDKDGLRQAILSACRVKKMERNIVTSFTAGYVPLNALNVVVAYDGPRNIDTVVGWIKDIHNELNIIDKQLFSSPDEKIKNKNKSIDLIIILKNGFVYYDNTPISFMNHMNVPGSTPMKWISSNGESGNLLLLFIKLLEVTSNLSGSWLNFIPYVSSLERTTKSTSFD